VSPGNLLIPNDNLDLRWLLMKSRYVISGNSTVLLEALVHRKLYASLGEGVATNHQVCLECHHDRSRLSSIENWCPDWEQVDRLLYRLLQYQLSVRFWERADEKAKVWQRLQALSLVPG